MAMNCHGISTPNFSPLQSTSSCDLAAAEGITWHWNPLGPRVCTVPGGMKHPTRFGWSPVHNFQSDKWKSYMCIHIYIYITHGIILCIYIHTRCRQTSTNNSPSKWLGYPSRKALALGVAQLFLWHSPLVISPQCHPQKGFTSNFQR